MKRVIIITLFCIFLPTSISHASTYSTYQERLCKRMVSRFAEDENLWRFNNNLLENRLGYRCIHPSEQWKVKSTATESLRTTRIVKDNIMVLDDLAVQMKENLDKWDNLHKEIVAAAKAFIPQATALGGREGIAMLDSLEDRLIAKRDSYKKIYEELIKLTPDQKKYWDRYGKIDHILRQFKIIERDFEKVPEVIY